ncbi:MAG: AAA family ATPase [Eubacteriales bacterium]
MNQKLITMDAQTLLSTPFQPLDFVVENFMSQGLHLLAGSPKIGKSWLALWLCLQITKGEPVWDFKTTKADVLYLCLEDSFLRIQNRLFDLTSEAPPTLHFCTLCQTIESGLDLQLGNFLTEHPTTKLVVIDTLQKIRGTANPNSTLYASDYHEMALLKNLADRHKIAILLIHHLRKAKDSDPLNMISGSVGISGATDTNFVLMKDGRTEATARLVCSGRDIEQLELFLEFLKDKKIWQLTSPVELQKQLTPTAIFSLCDLMKKLGNFTGNATELASNLKAVENVEIEPAKLKKYMMKHFEVLQQHGIVYNDMRTRQKRVFSLTYDGMTAMTLMTDVTPMTVENTVSEIP